MSICGCGSIENASRAPPQQPDSSQPPFTGSIHDLVGLSDIAEIAGISRQAMGKLMLAHTGDFPPPIHEGTQAIWHLAAVLDWLEARRRHQIAPEPHERNAG